jgi:hypothetical protein
MLRTITIITCLLFFFTCSYTFLIVSIFTEHAGEHKLPNTCATCVCLTKYALKAHVLLKSNMSFTHVPYVISQYLNQ